MGNKSKSTRRSLKCTATGGSASGSTLRWTDTYVRTAANVPKYKQLIAQGSSATGSLVVEAFRHRQFLAESSWLVGSTTYKANRGGLGPITLNSGYLNGSVKTTAQNAASLAIRQRISQEQNPFKGMTFLGELRDTIAMIKSPARGMRELLTEFGKQRVVDKRRLSRPDLSKALADSWLELQFGWKPLLSDLDDAARAAAGICHANGIVRLSVARDAITSTSNVTSSGADTGVSGACRIDQHWVYHARQSYHVGLKTSVEAQTPLDNLLSRSGFSLDEVVPTIWELLPWSFFIDYFSNIGDVLQATSVDMSNVAWVSGTLRESVELRQASQAIATSGNKVLLNGSAFAWGKYERITRSSASVPNPVLRFRLPGSDTKFLNIAALARLRFL